jgi:hypothetical protein
MSVVQNSGMQGTNVVIDISNINPSEVLENVIKLSRESYGDVFYISQRSVIDMDVSNNYDVSYSFQITTTYRSQITPSLNVKYINGIEYTSAVFSFRVEPYEAPEVIKNGTFTFSIQPEYNKGVTRDIPSPWIGELCSLSENVNSSANLSAKYLNIPEVSNHLILYNPKSNITIRPRLYQEIPFLFKDYYKLSYYVANHVPAGSPFAYSASSKSIEYQIKLMADDVVLFETSPISSNESSWNKVEILFYFPNSYKNVIFTIQRTKSEFNNLFLTDISLTGLGQIFDSFHPHTTFIENEWVLPSENSVNSWKGIMPEGTITGNVYSLSSNMTIGFCLYIHKDNNSSGYKGIFDLAGHPSIYFKENTLKIDNDGVTRIQTATDLKIPIYYHVTFDQKFICLYINGEFESSIGSSTFFTEASPEDLIFIGTPEMKTRGYLMNDVKLYDFPLQTSQIRELYKSFDYSQIGNSSDLTGHFVIVGMGTSSFFTEDVSFSLNNGQVLSNKIILYTPLMRDVLFNSTTKSSYSVTLTFWGKNLNGKMSFKNDNNQSLLDITCDSNQIIPSLNTSLAIPRNSNDLQHYSWTFNISGESKAYLNGYMYDASNNENLTTNFFTDCSSISFNLSETSKIGDIKIFDKILSPSEILTNYYNYYSISSTYNYQSGIYIVTINAPENVTYSIEYYNNNNITTGYGRDNVDISMSELNLNNFHKNNGSIKFTLTEYNIFTNIYGSGHPYLTVEDLSDNEITDISENTTFQVRLHNAPTNDEYAFTITGSAEAKDFLGGTTSGFITNQIPIQITMKNDYKTEGTEPFIFSIANLKVATSVNVLDTTKNMLYTDPYRVYMTGEVFVISLQIPIDEEDLYDVLDISYELINSDGFANRVDNETSLTFHRESNDIRSIDISFIAITPEVSRKFTLKLVDYESSVKVIINDIIRPELKLSKTSVNEGDSVILTLKTPLNLNGSSVPFYINQTNGINSDDIFCNDLNYSQTDLSGVFVVQDASASLVFAINPNNSYSEGRETLIFCLSDYNDISASVFIIDTSMPVSCRWEITDLTDKVISTINEGESFKVSLITNGIADTTDVSYTITGIVPVDLLGSQEMTGVFNVSNNTRQFRILNDFSTDGSKYMVFTTNFNDPLILDVSASILINDTSQSPDYQVTTNVTNPQNNSAFIISFRITNYSLLTETQKNEQLSYTATLLDPSGILNKIRGPLYGRIISSNGKLTQNSTGMIHTFEYTCLTSESNTFIFRMGGKSLQVNLNNNN